MSSSSQKAFTTPDGFSERQIWEEQKRLLEQAKEEAERAAEIKTRFLANMSHEIRTPMTAILGYTEALADKGISRQRIEEIARIIRDNSEYLLHILNDILDYSKMEVDIFRVEESTFLLESLLWELQSIFNVTAQEKGLELVIKNTTPYPATILSDPIRLKQIMLNLVGNAFKFTEKGKVEIIVSWVGEQGPGPGQLRLDVKDTGKGISKESLERIFRPFEQENDSNLRRYQGTGLGLAISQRLIHLLCGNLTVESQIDQGSCFSVFLPQQVEASTAWNDKVNLSAVTNHAETSDRNKTTNGQPLKGCRVLLVEDGIDNQRLFSMILKKAGADVTQVNNGQEAVEAFEKSLTDHWFFDVILMDMQMPVMDGLTATKRIREQGFNNAIIALTAHAMQEERDQCFAAGCTDFLTKPILRDVFLSAVAKVWQSKQS